MAKIADSLGLEMYDEIYAQSWQAALAKCEAKLERSDHNRALLVKSADDFRAELRHLLIEFPAGESQEVIMLLFPASEHYETFAEFFVSLMIKSVDVSMLWGLLFLVVKLSLESKGTSRRISRMLKDIGHKLQLLNEIHSTITDFRKVKAETVEINREMVALWLDIIMIFRTQFLSIADMKNPTAWESLNTAYNQASKNIDEATRRIEQITLVSSRQPQMIDLAMFHNVLNMRNPPQSFTLPCNTIPVARNLRFFGRQDVLAEIDGFFNASRKDSGMAALALYGLGGIGKSQIALEYAWRKQSDLDAVLWIPAESEIAILQGLSLVATTALKLPDAEPQSHRKNAILVMEWLKTSDAKWLLVYDNVESAQLFENFWPVSNHGSIFITTRQRGLTAQPINKSVELLEFSPRSGAQFLLQQLPRNSITESDPDFQYALDVSNQLEGHALAISQMAALITARGLSLQKFLALYERNRKKIHRERKTGWKYIGYKHSLDTVWELSFQALESDGRSCLGILSLLMPDLIPQELFSFFSTNIQHSGLRFCVDEYRLGEVFELLANLALIKINEKTDSISIHRLVQSEFIFHSTNDDRQQAFDSVVLLLLDAFPSRGNDSIDDSKWYLAERYLPQVLTVFKNFRDSQKESEPLKSSRNLIELICNTLWYVRNVDTAGNKEIVIKTAFMAWEKWDFLDKDPLLYAYILSKSLDHDLWNGEFQSASSKAQEALRIYNEHLAPDHETVLVANSDYALCFGSSADYERGANFLSRAERIFDSDPDRYGISIHLLVNQNTARNSYCRGDFRDAETRLSRNLEKGKELGSLYWIANIHVSFCSLYLRMKDIPNAELQLQQASEAIEEFGSNRNILLNSQYAYFLGRLRLAQGRISESIQQFEKTVAIDGIQLSPRGYRARNIYALSQALCASPERKAEGMKMARTAAKAIGTPLSDGENWEAFDLLIRIVER